MALPPIVISIVSQGVSQATSQISGVTTATNQLGQSGKNASEDMKGVADSLRAVGAANSGINATEQAIRDVTRAAADEIDELGKVAEKLEGMGETAGKVRNVGLALTATGAAGIALSNSLASVAEEGNAVEARLEAVFESQKRMADLPKVEDAIADVTVRGHFDDDDMVRQSAVLLANWEVKTEDMGALLEAAGRQAQTTGQSIDGLANAFGKALATGNFEGLKKTAVSFSEVELAAIKAAYAVSEQAGQMEVVKSITAAVARTTGELGSSLTEAQQKANDAARAMDDFQTNVGTGAKNAQSNIQELGGNIISVINLRPEMEEQAGVFLTYGSYAATAVGGILTLGAQVAQMAIAWKLAKTTQAAASVAAAAAADVEAISVGGAGAASAAGGAGAAAGSVGFGALAISIWAAVSPLLVFVAVAIAAAAVMYALGKAIIWKDEQAAKKGKEDVENRRRETYDKQVVRRDEGKRQTKSIDVKKGESYEAWYKRHKFAEQDGNDGTADTPDDKPAVDMDKLSKMVADAKKGAPMAPVAGGAAVPVSAIPVGALAGVGARTGGTRDVSEAQADVDQLQSEIEALKTEAKTANKYKKAAIGEQIALKQKDLARAKEELKAAKSAEKDADKAAKERQKRAEKSRKDASDIDKIEAASGADGRIAALEVDLDEAKREGDAAKVESLTFQIEMAKAVKTRAAELMDAALIADKTDRAAAIRLANARYEASKQPASRAAKEAFADVSNKNLDAQYKGEDRLQKIRLGGQFDGQIGGLEDQLSAAKDAKDAAKIEALTLQIETAKAEEARQNALIDAAGISDRVEKSYALQAIQAEFDNATSSARRAARRARRDAEKSNESDKGDGAQSISDSAIRARMAIMAGPRLGGAIGVNYGDRFAQSDALRPAYNSGPLASFQSYAQNEPRMMDIGALDVPGVGSQGKARVKSQGMNAAGQIIVEFEKLVLDTPRIGDLRGRTGGRR